MNIRTEFTEPECEWFRAVCNFTPDERAVFDLRVKDHSRIEIAMKRGQAHTQHQEKDT